MKKLIEKILNSKNSNSLPILLYTFFCFAALIVIEPFYEEGSTPSRVSLIKGLFFEPITDWPVNQIFISDFYAYLYQLVPAIPWFGIIELSLVLLILILACTQLAKLRNPLILVIFFIASVDDVLYMSYTRTASLLMIFAPTLLVLILLKHDMKASLKNFVIGSILPLLCVVGFVNKPFAVSYAIALNVLFIFSYFLIEIEKRKAILKSAVFVLAGLMIVFSIIFATYYFKSSDDHKLAITYSSDFYNLNSANSFKLDLSPVDSVGILLLKKNFISDRNYYNQDLVNRIARNSNKRLIDLGKFIDSLNFERVISLYIPQIIDHHKVELLVIFVFFLLILFVKQSFFRFKLPLLLFLFGTLFVLLGITFMIKSELRVSSPIMLFAIFGIFQLFQAKFNFHIRYTLVQIALLVILIFLTYEKLITAKKYSNLQNQMTKKNQLILNKLANTFNEKNILIFALPSYKIAKGKPFKDLKNTGRYQAQTYDVEAMTYMDSFKSKLNAYCGSNEITDFYRTLFEQNETSYFLSNDEWNELLKNYLLLNYSIEIDFEIQNFTDLNVEFYYSNLKVYKVSKFNSKMN